MKQYTFAIGDIHGRLDLLLRARVAITDYLDERDAAGSVIFLGDYVDRGPDSKGVIEFLMEVERLGACTCLKGNHEEMMIRCLDGGPDDMDWWCGNGGQATLDSYGGRRNIPKAHLDWLANLPVIAQDDHRIFVHAGLMPGVPLEKQKPEQLMWVRDHFLLAEKDFEGWPHIVHGHTPRHPWKPDPAEPERLGWRTNLDTMAFASGVLAVGVFTDEQPGPVDILKVTTIVE